MAWRELFPGRTGGLDDVHQRLRDMLDSNRHTLSLAINGLLGTTDPITLHDRVRRSDDRVDHLARQIRLHGPFTPGQPRHAQLAAYRNRLDTHLDNTRDTLRTHDPTMAAELITQTINLTDEIDLAIDLLLITEHADSDATATARDPSRTWPP